ncbi:APC family permease [Salinibacterium sp. NSLL150]|uniref:APC family permease n=1 Tax=unclassified Salinibacterium TaxID=2632331 RepID=UPI0018CE9E83|nr:MULTISPECIES: APC family permease [unclassified Salinibacterium]MBH0097977.1 APC family permease [Salinibacterium sp. NSLL35]MBH0100732.1 APC family permease [Salinibacterium sp. NSLL150]MBH0103491.1 APC family permease [Salinibacterium sp. NSLL16]MBH0106252.1 APC family permease [Salinibacterium sp. NSLL17]
MSALERAIAQRHPVHGFSRESPLHGLDRRSIGFVEVLAQSVSAIAPAAAATTMPLLVASIAGSATVFSIATAGLLALLIAFTVNQFTRRMAATGSLYTFVAKGFGTDRAGTTATLATSVGMLIGYSFIAMFALAGGTYYVSIVLARVIPDLIGSPLATGGIMVALASIVLLVLARGIRLSSRVTLMVETLSVAVLLILIVALLIQIGPHTDWSAVTRQSFAGSTGSFSGIAVGAVLALTAYVGFESSAALGVEVRRPFRNIPRALVWTVLGSLLFYVLAATAQVMGFEVLGADFSQSTSPVNELAEGFGLGSFALVLDIGIAASFLACTIASTTALARVLFSLSRDGILPRRLGSTHPKLHTPLFAIGVSLLAVTVVPLAFVLAGAGIWNTMQLLLVVAAAGYITAYIMVCFAAPAFLNRIGELSIRPLLTALVAGLSLTIAFVTYLAVEVAGERALAVALYVAVMSLGTAVLLLRVRKNPRLALTIGNYDEPTVIDVLGGTTQAKQASD